MRNFNLEKEGIQKLEINELQNINGGFIPLVIFGVSFSAKAVAGMMGACFLTGVGVGAAVAAGGY